MKREIKFRAFQDNQMLKSPSNSNYGLQKFFGSLYEDAPIMQFTGLYDKNDNEIYEGDILQDQLNKMTYVVKFGRCQKYAFNGWYVENESYNYTTPINGDYDTNTNSQIAIIGNIHEPINQTP